MLIQLLIYFVLLLSVSVGSISLPGLLPKFSEGCTPTISMIDASAKLPDGILSGNPISFGNFDECMEIQNGTMSGKYCFVKIVLPQSALAGLTYRSAPQLNYDFEINERMALNNLDNNTGVIVGWCLPKICPLENMTSAINPLIKLINKELEIIPLLNGICQTKENLTNDYTTGNIIFIVFLSSTLFLMIISTIYDTYLQHYEKEPAHIILTAFSVKMNGKKLLSVSTHPDQLPCLHGIRFLSMLWVIYGHRVASSMLSPIDNFIEIENWLNNAGNMYILNAPVSVDTFFVLSGLLVGYGYCLAMDKGIKFNILMFYLHRYLRLTPVLAVVVWFHTTIIEFIGSGPIWPMAMSTLKGFCVENWWPPLLYIQNYYNTNEMCLGQSWYLSVDMQLFILSPIILIPLWRWPKYTLLGSAVLIIGSVVSSFVVTYVKELPAFTFILNNPDFMDNYYITTHTRFGPWLMGLVLGYYIFKLKKQEHHRIKLHPAQVTFAWIISLALLFSTVFAGFDLIKHPTNVGNSFFNGLHRHGWALGVCWVIYACTQGYGGPVNSFLSWGPFQILSRFTYTIYLVHLSVQYVMLGAIRTTKHFSIFQAMYDFWGDFVVSLTIAVCLTLAFESPMITIEKVLFKTGSKDRKKLPLNKGDNVLNTTR